MVIQLLSLHTVLSVGNGEIFLIRRLNMIGPKLISLNYIDFPLINMADISQWLGRLKDYGQRVLNDYSSAGDQASTMGNELAGKARSMDAARQALDQDTQVAPGNMGQAAPAALAPYENMNPGYKPIGGQNALRQLYQGRPPMLKRGSGPGF